MVISFSVKEAREHLEKHGFVYTLRPKMRKRIGKDWYNYFRTDIKRGDVVIKYIGDYTNKDLTDFVRHSGFGSLEAWLKKAGDNCRYLYVVDLMGKVAKREVKLAFTCLECGKFFTTWHDGEGWVSTICSKCHLILNTTGEKEEREKEGTPIMAEIVVETRTEGEGTLPASKSSFYNSVDVKNLTPAQQKHFKTIMRKEVRK